ncbi:MAG: cbb3-type cytochrome c oxidase subunit II [bacterium]|nr:cbb3-type cytochrome c oxidase subunit II [bacterium]
MIKRVGNRELMVLLAASVLLVVVGVVAVILDTAPEWKYYQSEFEAIVAERFGDVDSAEIPTGIQQIWLDRLGRVDRCTTCHLGATWQGLEDVEQPWTSHPRQEIFETHPIEEFGCTPCHGGQGFALAEYDAHGFVAHWEEPLLSDIAGSEYDPRNPPPLHEIQCNFCHRYERSTEGMPFINSAKELVRTKGCKICHLINGDGGKLGPDLTHEGDKHPEEFDFSNLVSEQVTVFNWHLKHFQSPATIVPNSIMPEMNFQSTEAQALAMLVMSWKDDTDLPRAYLPGVELKDETTPEETARDRRMREGDGAFFVENSCFVCHSIVAFDIKSPTDKGPDLSYAPDDVRARFNKTVEEFLFEPTGTMKIILESQIVLTDEQKWEAVAKIMRAYDVVKNRSAEEAAN